MPLSGGHLSIVPEQQVHDDIVPHSHLTEAEKEALADVMWRLDNVEFTTVGIDVGSSTSHLMFSRVHLRRRKNHLSSRYVVIKREILWSSPVRFTPFLDDETIDAEDLGRFFAESYAAAGLKRSDVDTGAVILTGEAIKRRNARAITDLFAEDGGKFVCATAGHRLECSLAAHGSGAVALSKSLSRPVLNIDIGGGTTKFALCVDGVVTAVSAIAIGARLVATGEDGKLVRVEESARVAADSLGLRLRIGERPCADAFPHMAREFVRILAERVSDMPLCNLARTLLLTEELPKAGVRDIAFSGGVSEYVYGRETRDLGDLAGLLADGLYGALMDRGYAIHDPGQGIRATAIGASQFTIQVSGRTIYLGSSDTLPLHNLPVIRPPNLPEGDVDPEKLTEDVCVARARMDMDLTAPVAVALGFPGSPHYHRLRATAQGIHAAFADAGDAPLVLIVDSDVGRLLGRLMAEEFPLKRRVVCIDGIELGEFDYIDVGAKIPTAQVVPVVVKSLLFGRG